MKKRMRRTMMWIGLILISLFALSFVVPSRSVIVVTGPDGEHRIESTGTGSNRVRLEMSDGSFVETYTR